MAIYLNLQNTERIFDQMKRSGCKLWWIYDTDGTPICEKETDEGTIDDAYNDLVTVLNDLEGDYAIVVIRNKLPNKDEAGNYKRGANVKGSTKFEFRVRLKQPGGSPSARGAGGLAGIGDGGIGALYMQMGDLKAQVASLPLQAKIEALEAELKQQKKGGGEGVWERLAEKFFDRVEMSEQKGEINIGFNKNKQPVNGNGGLPMPAGLNPQQQQMWVDVDAVGQVLQQNTFAFISDLAKRAKDNPDFFKQFAQATVEHKLDLKNIMPKP